MLPKHNVLHCLIAVLLLLNPVTAHSNVVINEFLASNNTELPPGTYIIRSSDERGTDVQRLLIR